MTDKREYWLDLIILFLLAAALVWPLFQTTYLNRWESIESTFIADARFLNAHWPHPRWQPLWYAGTRFDYVYPPALRYGTALLARVFSVPEARGYHLYTAFFYCLGIAGVYLFVRVFSGSRGLAWMAALAAALLSPSFLFLGDIRRDASHWLVPQRLGVLVRYGEGPHITAFSLIPFALAASCRALERHRPAMLALAGALCALVVSNNFYGATALAILFPILVWSLWAARRDPWVWGRAAAVVALACGMTAFWLVPSYIRITLRNMRYVSQEGSVWSAAILLAAVIAFGLFTARIARGKPELAYRIFVAGAAAFLSLIVLGWFAWGFRVIGEPIRLVPELDLALILAALEGVRWLWARRSRVARLAAVAVLLAAAGISRHYLRHAWELYPPDPHPEQRLEYRIADWMARHQPEARAVATGSVRFWYNAWHDLPQLGGGSEQGLLNTAVMPAQAEILMGPSAPLGIAWMQAMGVDVAVVHTERSREIYHDWKYPHKFEGVLPVLYDSGQGDIIYRVPRRSSSLAHVVERKRIEALRPPAGSTDEAAVRPYADAIENGPDQPVTASWKGPEAMRIHARVGEGQSVLVQVSYDPAWRAFSGDTALPIQSDSMGFLRIDAPPGDHDIRLEFHMPLENLAGWIIFAWTLVVAAGLIVLQLRISAAAR
jgi:hypothetical protein